LPIARGFERFYGGHLTVDLVDHAIEFVAEAKLATPDRPFFMYLCAGTIDGPSGVPEQLEMGLVPPSTRPRARDAGVADWGSLRDDERSLHTRMMEVFAGCLEHTDYQIGRLLDFLDCTGQLDNTLIMVVSEDTRSAEEWSFRPWRGEPHRGAASDPFLVHWPRGISRPGAVRHQYAHVIDMVPTVLEALEIEPPSQLFGVPQSPIQGISFAQAFRSSVRGGKRLQAEAPRNHPADTIRLSAVTTEAPAPAGM
jgi:arylsulfatase A-like enzyme